jgi:flagellar motor switch protein FliM
MTGTMLVTRTPELALAIEQEIGAEIRTGKTSRMTRIEEHPSWEVLSQLQITLRAGVPLNRFRVRDLLALKEGQVFESLSPDTDDVSLWIGQVQVGWSEFEVLEQKMALRLTRLG